MSFSNFLRHKCNIYHIKKTDVSPGYGLPASPKLSYPDEPDIKNLSCYFHRSSMSISQSEPQAKRSGRVKLSLPAGTDIRLNDRIVDIETGLDYTAELPRPIRNHHITVMLRLTSEQEVLK